VVDMIFKLSKKSLVKISLVSLLVVSSLTVFFAYPKFIKADEQKSQETVTYTPSSVKVVEISGNWSFDILQEDDDIKTDITVISDNVLELTVHAKHDLRGGYKWDMMICNFTEMENLQYMEEDTQRGFEYSTPIDLNYIFLENEGLSSNLHDDTEDYGYVLFSSGSKNQLPKRFRLIFPEGRKHFKIYTGNGTEIIVVTSTDEGLGGADDSWDHRIFYDLNNNRWHLLYIDSAHDIHTASSGDGVTWVDGIDIDSGTYDYEDFSCVLDFYNSNTYLHCVYSVPFNDYLNYRRMTLTGVDPYITAGAEQKPFDALDLGKSSSDDVEYPRIILDSNRCVLVAFGFENDSADTSDEHTVVLIKENDTCGDGTFAIGDIETGFPIYNIQNEIGYEREIPVGLESFGDLDAQIFWIDTDSYGTSADLETVFFDGDSNTIGTQRTLDDDVEFYTLTASFSSVIVGEKTITFGMDDGTTDLDAYITSTKGGDLTSQIDTGLQMEYKNFVPKCVDAIVDTRSVTNDIWVFAVDDNDPQDIWYAKSMDSGSTWGNQTLWIDEGGDTEVKFLSAFFNNETCDIIVTWIGGFETPWNVTIDMLNTGNCPDETSPTYSDNSTNSTIAGAIVSHNLKWTDETGLATTGGYIFSTNNTGTWANETWVAFSSNPDWSNVTDTSNSTVGAVIEWCVYANDTSNNWNGISCVSPFTYVTTSDTCIPPESGDWNVLCSDNCFKSNENIDIVGNLRLYGGDAGTLTISNVNISFEGFQMNATNCKIVRHPPFKWIQKGG